MSKKCYRCGCSPGQPILCTRCLKDVKREWEKAIEELENDNKRFEERRCTVYIRQLDEKLESE